MRKKILVSSALGLALVLALLLGLALSASAVSGAAFTTANPWVDGTTNDLCRNSLINCNIYEARKTAWLNGGSAANEVGPDGEYFFVVLAPGGRLDPNDGSESNLSDDFDRYTDRTFRVVIGEIREYNGTHDRDSGDALAADRQHCSAKDGCAPDGQLPLIRLHPYARTPNSNGMYILAVCSLAGGYPVSPRSCEYDAFKVNEGPLTYDLMLAGTKFEDVEANHRFDAEDPGLPGWQIMVTGTGFAGEAVEAVVVTGEDGQWAFGLQYNASDKTGLAPAQLQVCEAAQPGWAQSLPAETGETKLRCYERTIPPAALAYVDELDFGNWLPGVKSGVKFEDLNANGARDADEPGLPGWTIYIDYNNNNNWDMGEPFGVSGEDGAYTIKGIRPGTWVVRELAKEGWTCSYPEGCAFEHAFASQTVYPGNDFGDWYPAVQGGYKWHDRDADGEWDDGEPAVPGWQIEVYDSSGALVGSQLTDEWGFYEFTLKPGVYTLKELCPPSGSWFQTFPAAEYGCGSGVFTVTLQSRGMEPYNHFGNFCVSHADFGNRGYWHDKNGVGEMVADLDFASLLTYINSLDPYREPSGMFDVGEEPFDGFDEFNRAVLPPIEALEEAGYVYNELSQFLVDANANSDPRELLAQQLLAFIFNANYRLDDPQAAIMLPDGSWVIAHSLIAEAVAAWSSSDPGWQNTLQEKLYVLNESDSLPYINYFTCK